MSAPGFLSPSGQRIRRSLKRRPFLLSDFGGLNDDTNNAALDNRDLRVAKNVMFYRERLLGGRFGYVRDPFTSALNAADPTPAVTGIIDWQPDRDAAPRCIFIAGGDGTSARPAINEDDGDGTPVDRTGTATVTAGNNNVFTFGVVKGSLYGTNGVDHPFELTDTGGAADMPGWFSNGRVAKYFHAQFNYLFAAGFTGTGDTGGGEGASQHPMGVQHDQLADPSTWLEGAVVDAIGAFGTFGDEYVTGMFRHRDFMMLGTNRRIYPVLYTGDFFGRFAVQRPLEVGLAHQRAVASINGEFTFFMDPRGEIHTIREVVRGFGDVGVSRSLTGKIRNYISNLNSNRIQFTHATFLEDRGWIVFAVSQGVNQSIHNELLVLDINQFQLDDPDPRQTRWLQWTNIPANSMAVLLRDRESSAQSAPQANGIQNLVFGTTTGWAKRFVPDESTLAGIVSFDEADDGTQDVIETEVATKYFDFGAPLSEKAVVEATFDVEPSSDIQGPTVTIEYDYGVSQSRPRNIDMAGNVGAGVPLGSFVLGTSRLASSQQVTRNRIAFVGAGTNASLRIQKDLSGTEQWKIQAATLLVEQRGETPETP